MFLKVLIFHLVLLLFKFTASSKEDFIFYGFTGANLSLDGTASITHDGLLRLTNTTTYIKGHAFYPVPFHFRSSSVGDTSSFSTTFIVSMISQIPSALGGHGVAFLLSPTKDLSTALATQYLGLFNANNNGNPSNHVLAIELDTIENLEFQDIDHNHAGININSLQSNTSHHAGYVTDATGEFKDLDLISGEPMQVWVDYHGGSMKLNVTLAPVNVPKPKRPLLSSTVNLSSIILDLMYVGFSSSNGMYFTSHYIHGWSFKINGVAQTLDFSKLPRVPRTSHKGNLPKTLLIWLPLAASVIVLVTASVIMFIVTKRIKYAELLEDWELDYGPYRFSYKDLFAATKGFEEKELLGTGGFGRVYRGVLPTSKVQVAVKRVSHESRQGMREFIAEIVSIGRLRHRNIVQLLGYCRRKGELLLVYDYMPNGSLDKFLYDRAKPALDWAQRFRIIKGAASGLLYLHEEWEQVVIHRDIKASNVLLDGEMNGRLGDFGLARLYDHGSVPKTTHIAGTMGYLAPELVRTGRASKATDVFAFGVFVLEVACGRRPIDTSAREEGRLLVDWVLENWRRGTILETRDPRLGNDYVVNELELILKLGLLCLYPSPSARPSMRQVVQYLEGDAHVPDLFPACSSSSMLALLPNEGLDGIISHPSSLMTASVLSGGR